MEKKSIGGFIAALRKAAGMTQQQMADRLGVSNKAVSRWERDESAPDLSVIPEIAALFGVTCDELLRGARVSPEEAPPAREAHAAREAPVAGEIPAPGDQLLRRALSRFKSAVGLALGAAFTGLILHFAVSYGFYKPVIGFCLLLIFAAASLTLTFLARNRLEEQAGQDAPRAREYLQTRFRFTFFALFCNGMAVLWCLPFILIRDAYYADSVILFREYLNFVFPFACATAILGLFSYRFGRRVCLGEGSIFRVERRLLPFNIIQCAAIPLMCAASTFLHVFAGPGWAAALWVPPLLAAAAPILIFARRNRGNAGLILLMGLRNIGLLIALFMAAGAFSPYTVEFPETGLTESGISYAPGAMMIAAGVFFLSAGGYMLLRRAVRPISGEI